MKSQLLLTLVRRRPESEIAAEWRVVTKTESGQSVAGEMKRIPYPPRGFAKGGGN